MFFIFRVSSDPLIDIGRWNTEYKGNRFWIDGPQKEHGHLRSFKLGTYLDSLINSPATSSIAIPALVPMNIMSALSPPEPPALDNTFGALLIGTFIGLVQYGWTANQCYRYYRTYHEDRWLLKGLVTTVLLLETFHSFICMHGCYYYLVTGYFNPQALASGVWSLSLLEVATGVVVPVTQSFFLCQIYFIGRGFRPLVFFVALLLVAEFALATSGTVEAFLVRELHTQKQALTNSAAFGLAAAADTIISAALTYSLHRSRTGFESTDNTIDTLILYTINTGILTDVFNIACFVFAVVMQDNLIYAGIAIVGCKLYANTLMAVLNSRGPRSSSTRALVQSYPASLPMQPIHRGTTPCVASSHAISIQVSTVKTVSGADLASRCSGLEDEEREDVKHADQSGLTVNSVDS